ncbi:MAG: PadR family transcriptional regulator [Oscillatoria sp. SIO1A7]|nr:PadR family transcriptional regulator [Oscillatoria sp. SIO1A7]
MATIKQLESASKTELELIEDSLKGSPRIHLEKRLAIAYIASHLIWEDSYSTELKKNLEESQPIFKLSHPVLCKAVKLLLKEGVIEQYKEKRNVRGRPRKMLRVNESQKKRAKNLAFKWNAYLFALSSAVKTLRAQPEDNQQKAIAAYYENVGLKNQSLNFGIK